MTQSTPLPPVNHRAAPYPHKPIHHPATPLNGSPVPWLTSLHATWRRGPYGRANYRGNCSGYLIKDLLRYFAATRVLDPMTGSGTCRDVCQDLGIECHSFDLRHGQDANDWTSYRDIGQFDFVWLHPPYWRQIVYSDDERCLSTAPTLADFIYRLRGVLRKCRSVLSDDGKIAVLMGNYSDHGRFMPLVHYTMKAALDEGLWPACTDIVRLQYHNSSSRKTYRSSFIPGVHDTCLVFGRNT
jgi:DNA modification methylase